MNFGLRNAPTTFATLMNRVLDGILFDFVVVFIDDLLIYSNTLEEHLEHIEQVLKKLQAAKLCVNIQKCVFAAREVNYLGNTFNQNGISQSEEKIRAIKNYPRPTSVKELQKFIGLCQYQSTFVEHFTSIYYPLYKLLKKGTRYTWTNEHETSFIKLKNAIANGTSIHGIDYSLRFVIRCDASDVGLGAVLLQIKDGEERVIYYASRKLRNGEINLNTSEKECLAIIWSISKFKEYIFGEKITIQTDHKALIYWKSMEGKSKKLDRWKQELLEWDYTIEYRPGRDNVAADALSRAPVDITPDEPNFLESTKDIMFVPTCTLIYETPSLEKIKTEQNKDPIIKKIKQTLSKIEPEQLDHRATYINKNFKLHDGMVYRVFTDENVSDELGSTQAETPVTVDTDSLSRQVVPQVSPHELEQWLSRPSSISSKELANRNRISHPVKILNCNNSEVMVPMLPTSLVSTVLKIFHDAKESAHMGKKKNIENINSEYWKNKH